MSEAIIVQDLTKRFRLKHVHSLKEMAARAVRRAQPEVDEFTALTDVSLTVTEGETLALLGFNGSGKSTLLKCISGVLTPDAGQIAVRGRIAGLIEVGAGFHPDLTGRENVYLNGAILGMSREQIEERFDEIVAFSEIETFIDTEVKFYSSGMFLRLAFSVAVHTDPDVFLVDEILAVGDEPFQHKCLERIRRLREEGKTLVIVSHDLNMVADLCERGVLLERGHVVADGDAHAIVERMRA
ncbi:ABC transporter ATP-binding protein [Serinibacter salmoneus]|uniref:ABC-2 type transport system ATP-binding protein n=1 Tax=Serinibacter salmoneus TaxID=556530 RepID=A0A2A9D102_9MICO|nr:ABC transporter ATP-binding protein [Serinibacter salmoneus]PFG20357.1 ABC-2 type transport system ATP-binding protein [Serinibacter salmoneus]